MPSPFDHTDDMTVALPVRVPSAVDDLDGATSCDEESPLRERSQFVGMGRNAADRTDEARFVLTTKGIMSTVASVVVVLLLYEFLLVPLALRRVPTPIVQVPVPPPIIPVSVVSPTKAKIGTGQMWQSEAGSPFSPRLRPYWLNSADGDASSSIALPLPDTGRYLRTNMGGQFNNQRQGLSLSVLFALALGRTLVVPRTQAEYSIRLNEVLDIPALAQLVPVISEDEYDKRIGEIKKEADRQSDSTLEKRLVPYDMRCHEWTDLFYLTRAGYEADPAQQEFIKKRGDQTKPRFLMDEFDTPPEAHDAVTMVQCHYWSFWRQDVAFPQNVMDDFEQRFGRHMHFRIDLWQRAGLVLDWLAALSALPSSDSENRFAAIHWRQTDQVPEWRITPDRIRVVTKEWGLAKGDVLYLATDEPKGEHTVAFVEHMRKIGVTVAMFENSPLVAVEQADAIGATYRSFIEQIVLAHASRFYPSLQSTYSGFVIRMRQWMHHPNVTEEARRFYAERDYIVNPALGVRPPTKDAPDVDIFHYKGRI